jgi:putative DNA primase/helicase
MVERSEAALIRAGVDVYQNADRLVRPVRSRVLAAPPAGSTQKRETSIPMLIGINEPSLKPTLTQYINYFKWSKDEEPVGCGVPGDLVSSMLSRQGMWSFPAVTGIISAPTLRPDGSVLAVEGWDQRTELLVMGPLPQMPPVPAKPSKDDAFAQLSCWTIYLWNSRSLTTQAAVWR